MKINIKFWIIVIIISSVIIFFKYFSLEKKKKYIFKRNFIENKYLKNITLDNKLYLIDSIGSNQVYREENYNIFYKEDTTKIFILKNKFKCFRVYEYDLNNKLIALGEYQNKIGFYIINKLNSKIYLIKEVEKLYEDINKNILSYNGFFYENEKYICYACNKISKIFIFNNDFQYINIIETKENIPNPELVSFDGITTYKRGKTFNTNLGVFIIDNVVNVISERTNIKDNIIIDRYDILNKKYLNSYKIEINEYNPNIRIIDRLKNKLFMENIYTKEIYSFIIKK